MVVGLETVLAIALGVALYDEQLTTVGIVAVVFVMSGTAILAAGQHLTDPMPTRFRR